MSDDAPSLAIAVRRALRGSGPRLALAVLAMFVVGALAAPVVVPYDCRVMPQIETEKNLAPSTRHLFGTDAYSRDVMSRVICGSQVSLGVAAGSVLLAITLGTAMGAIAGFFGGWADIACMRLADTVLSVPRLLMLMVLVASTGPLSVRGIIVALGLTGWPGTSRLVRTEVRSQRAREFVEAARALGVPRWKVLVTHVMPAVVPQLLVTATLAFASVVPLEAGLSFLGFGVTPPTASWGNIINEGVERWPDVWWVVFFPGLAIICTVLAVNTIGDRLREAVDPRQARTT